MKAFLILCAVSSAFAREIIIDLENLLGPDTLKTTFPGLNSDIDAKREYSEQELQACDDMLGKYVDETFVGSPSNDTIEEILKQTGGLPGQVDAVRKESVPEMPLEDPGKRPLPDSDGKYWLYNYQVTDYKTFFRSEHALKRFSGTPREFLDIRGTVAWIPSDFCGQLRVGEYLLDDTGYQEFFEEVACHLHEKPKPILSCKIPPNCTTQSGTEVCE